MGTVYTRQKYRNSHRTTRNGIDLLVGVDQSPARGL